jgi:hypothetical protein
MTVHALIAASAFGSVHDLLHSPAFDAARNIVLFLAVVFWLGLALWVYRDARGRTDDPLLVATAALLGLTVPYAGALIYLLFRPPETLADVRSRDLELRTLEEQLGLHAPHCPVCRAEVEDEYIVCPVCATKLKHPCAECSRALAITWRVCPYCEAPAIPATDLNAALTAELSAIRSATTHGRPRRSRGTRSASG